MNALPSPELLVHCDWSTDPRKRWMAKAVFADGRYVAAAAEPVGELDSLFRRIRCEAGPGGTALIGFDFPIGLASAYAEKTGIACFLPFLRGLKTDSPFFDVCREPEEVSLERPFYPALAQSVKRAHLETGLGLTYQELLRACERRQANRAEAGALFWTLGAKQAGKGAIVGWRDVLAPGVCREELSVWPFGGALDSLLVPGGTIVAETYPTQYYAGIFGGLAGSKGNREVRKGVARRILEWAADRKVTLSPELRTEIEAGFTVGSDDAFDAVMGLFGMIEAIQNYSPALEPTDPTIRQVEGWILGQPAC